MRSNRKRRVKGLTVSEILERERLADSRETDLENELSEYTEEPVSAAGYENKETMQDSYEYDEEPEENISEEYEEEPEEYEEEFEEYEEEPEEYDEEYEEDASEEFSEDFEEYSDENETEPAESENEQTVSVKKSEKLKKNNPNDRPAAKKSEKKKKNRKIGSIVLTSAVVFVVLCFAAYLAIGFLYYGSRFLKGTAINGRDVSDVSVAQYLESLEDSASVYTLTVMNKDEVTDTINGSDIELSISDTGRVEIENICKSQNKIMWPMGYMGSKYEFSVENIAQCNTDALDSIVMTSKGYNLPQTIASESVSLKYKDGKYQVTPPTNGDKIDKEAYAERVREYVSGLKEEMVIQNADVYVKSENAEKDEQAMNKACETANRIIEGSKILIKMGDNNEDITADVMNGIVSVDDSYNVTINDATIKAYVNNLNKKYSNMGMTRTFRTGHGTDVQVKGGDYGCSINTKTLVQDLNNAIFSKKPLDTTIKLTRNVLSGTGADIGRTYIEVDLTNQYLYMYVDGKLVKQCPVVTGLPGSRATPQGTYMLKNKMMDVPLVGDNYVTPVKYWMPFNGGIGLHDAVWQSRFGGELYKSKGSHGCVNLMMKDAGDIYKNAVVKMPVVCYYHNRIASFQPVASSGPVQGTYRALTDKELKMRADLLNGKKVTDSSAVRDSNEGQAIQQAPAAQQTDDADTEDNTQGNADSNDTAVPADADSYGAEDVNAVLSAPSNNDTAVNNMDNNGDTNAPAANNKAPAENTALETPAPADTAPAPSSGIEGGSPADTGEDSSAGGEVIKEIVVDPIE